MRDQRPISYSVVRKNTTIGLEPGWNRLRNAATSFASRFLLTENATPIQRGCSEARNAISAESKRWKNRESSDVACDPRLHSAAATSLVATVGRGTNRPAQKARFNKININCRAARPAVAAAAARHEPLDEYSSALL